MNLARSRLEVPEATHPVVDGKLTAAFPDRRRRVSAYFQASTAADRRLNPSLRGDSVNGSPWVARGLLSLRPQPDGTTPPVAADRPARLVAQGIEFAVISMRPVFDGDPDTQRFAFVALCRPRGPQEDALRGAASSSAA